MRHKTTSDCSMAKPCTKPLKLERERKTAASGNGNSGGEECTQQPQQLLTDHTLSTVTVLTALLAPSAAPQLHFLVGVARSVQNAYYRRLYYNVWMLFSFA